MGSSAGGGLEAGALFDAEVFVLGQAQLPVGPHTLLGGAAGAVLFTSDLLTDLGQDLVVGQRDEVPLADRDPRVREGRRGSRTRSARWSR